MWVVLIAPEDVSEFRLNAEGIKSNCMLKGQEFLQIRGENLFAVCGLRTGRAVSRHLWGLPPQNPLQRIEILQEIENEICQFKKKKKKDFLGVGKCSSPKQMKEEQTWALYIQGKQGEQWQSQREVEVDVIGNAQSTTRFIDAPVYL